MPKYDYEKYFPFSRIREEQRKAIEFALDSYESGKKVVMLDMGTGCGKSATAVTIARYVANHLPATLNEEGMPLTGAYILTTQKILQQQYLEDFGPGIGKSKNLMLSIKSSSNYKCGFYPDQTCAESRRVISQLGKKISGTEFQKHCRGNCPYGKDKQEFIDSPISVTNFSYFFAETIYGKKLKPRDFLIIDECHNVEAELGKFVEVSFSEKFAKEVIKCKIPTDLSSQDKIFKWIQTSYKTSVTKYFKNIEKLIASQLSENSSGLGDLGKQYEMLDKHIHKLERFLDVYNPNNWIVNVANPDLQKKKSMRRFEFKPVDVSRYSEENLFKFGQRILMLSATIIDKHVFCASVGLPVDEVAYLSIPSPFPIENRPIHYIPVGSMSMSMIDKSLPILVEAVQMLLERHSDVKGMIHCVNFKISQYLAEKIKSDRILTHSSENREEILAAHLKSNKPTVLISPSMMEGVDLSDDASRFQIMCKIPFPYLGDQVVKKRMENNRMWYNYQTAKSIIQAIGRSIRNESDYATTYILDSDWERFFRTSSHMFPLDFKKTII
jgi:ATP-dependent DNA helicase DinG